LTVLILSKGPDLWWALRYMWTSTQWLKREQIQFKYRGTKVPAAKSRFA
jgi:hypothetical protein